MSGAIATASGFPRPAFADLIASALADLLRLPGADITLRRSLLQVLAYMSAALASGEYDYIDWAVLNVLLPDTATGSYLDRWVNIFGLPARYAPIPAAGSVIFTGTNGTPIPAGTQVQTSNSGVVLATIAAGGISGTAATLAVQAVMGGVAGNLAAGTPVSLLVAIGGVLGTAVVATGGTVGGVDAENDAALRVRLLRRTGFPPQGGAAGDYVAWATAVAGVTRVWVYPLLYGPGTVGVSFTMDGRPSVIPLTADVTNVQNAIQASPGAPPAPVIATVSVFAPTASPLAITIHGLTAGPGYTLAQAQVNIGLALAALFGAVTPGGYGWDGQAEAFETGGVMSLSAIYGAIDNAAGVGVFDLAAPTADEVAGFGVLLSLGAVSYT